MAATKIIGMIPARMSSVRFPGKILFPFFGQPMIEHVRRRAALAEGIDDVYVATCDDDIADVVGGCGGKVIMTGAHHQNGTTRVAEAIRNIDCTHVILLQGDEPLLLPKMVEQVAHAITANPNGDAWNGTGPIELAEDLDRHSFVKCAISAESKVMYCFRRSPAFAEFRLQQSYIRKVLGLIAYRREFLEKLTTLPPSLAEQSETIEQMRIIENGFHLASVPFDFSLPSVNEPDEAQVIIDYIEADHQQRDLVAKTFPGLE